MEEALGAMCLCLCVCASVYVRGDKIINAIEYKALAITLLMFKHDKKGAAPIQAHMTADTGACLGCRV